MLKSYLPAAAVAPGYAGIAVLTLHVVFLLEVILSGLPEPLERRGEIIVSQRCEVGGGIYNSLLSYESLHTPNPPVPLWDNTDNAIVRDASR